MTMNIFIDIRMTRSEAHNISLYRKQSYTVQYVKTIIKRPLYTFTFLCSM